MWTLFAPPRADGLLPNSNSRWCVSDPLPPSAALPLTEGRMALISPFQGRRTVSPLFSILLLPYCHGADRQDWLEILVRGRRERSERGGRSHTILISC